MLLAKRTFSILLLLSFLIPVASSARQASAGKYICPPCGLSCDKEVFTAPGVCPVCGMKLIQDRPHNTISVSDVVAIEGEWVGDYKLPGESVWLRGHFNIKDGKADASLDKAVIGELNLSLEDAHIQLPNIQFA